LSNQNDFDHSKSKNVSFLTYKIISKVIIRRKILKTARAALIYSSSGSILIILSAPAPALATEEKLK